MMESDESTALLIVRAMLQQEEKCYKVRDYFQDLPPLSSEERATLHPVDADAREQIVSWLFNIMDACNYPKDNASVVMSCLDRFVSTSDGQKILLDRGEYQLAALAALYTCVKIHCPEAMSPDLIAKLSHGIYKPDDVEAMERRMLGALDFRVNPPISMDFVRIYLDIIDSDCFSFDERAQNLILELAGFQANWYVLDFDLAATNRASHVAVASLLNAIENILEYTDDGRELYESIHDEFLSLCCADIDEESLQELKRRLCKSIPEQSITEIFALHETSACENFVVAQKRPSRRDSWVESPRSVYGHGDDGNAVITI